MKLFFTSKIFITVFFMFFCAPSFSMKNRKKRISNFSRNVFFKKYKDCSLDQANNEEKIVIDRIIRLQEMEQRKVEELKKLKKLKKLEDEKFFTLKKSKKSDDLLSLESSEQQ